MNIQFRKRGGDQWQEITEKQLASVCLELCGGGWTASETRRAMILQRKILDGGKYRSRQGYEMRGLEHGAN